VESARLTSLPPASNLSGSTHLAFLISLRAGGHAQASLKTMTYSCAFWSADAFQVQQFLWVLGETIEQY
jgi:hypothetical protein